MWSKLQQCLSLHRLLDTFPNMIAVDNNGLANMEELDTRVEVQVLKAHSQG